MDGFCSVGEGFLVFDDAVLMLILHACPLKSRSMKANGLACIARGTGIMCAAPTPMPVWEFWR